MAFITLIDFLSGGELRVDADAIVFYCRNTALPNSTHSEVQLRTGKQLEVAETVAEIDKLLQGGA